MAIKKTQDIKLNVKPISIGLYHRYVFEGPCRFGSGDELTKEYDDIRNASNHKEFIEGLKTHLDLSYVNLMDPLYVERDENMINSDSMIEEIAKDRDEVDLYWLNPWGFEVMLEFARYYEDRTPVAIMHPCCGNASLTAAWWARGLEAYGFNTWDEANRSLRALRVRKMLRETKVLCVPRNDSTKSFTVQDSFINLEDVTLKLGTRFAFYNMHEMIDQVQHTAPDQNASLPGRCMLNLTSGELLEASAKTDQLIDGALECDMEREHVQRSVEASMVINKLMDFLDCNAFTAPCPEMCATRRLNEEKFTLCLTHSINNESGICSACEYDLPALLSMVILSGFSHSAPYMGNTALSTVFDGGEISGLIGSRDREALAERLISRDTICYSFHAVPNRKLFGYDQPLSEYAIRSFAASGWGATIRYDFNKDKGKTITLCRLDPTCSKLFVARASIIGGVGYENINCSEGVFFEVENRERWETGQAWVGSHIPLVYGDYFDDVVAFGKMCNFEILSA